ncbi:hypothetical protein PPROV_000370100 [Pycnococcus provasolii]|uniref:DUF3172 domain-containing protein n=3 Tax=Pycnococcus provasolii TaxID=41880 RepID=A0A830HI23_9CHLO|nr:hypothetical protein PPROV_000370100 [Pycnococcus provasolii]
MAAPLARGGHARAGGSKGRGAVRVCRVLCVSRPPGPPPPRPGGGGGGGNGNGSTPQESSWGSNSAGAATQRDVSWDAATRQPTPAYAPPREFGAPPPPPPPRNGRGGNDGGGGGGSNGVTNALIAGAFAVGIGTGVVFTTTANFEPDNLASTEMIDRKTPNSEVCMANGYSSMVFDQRLFVSFNPFNVYVAQPEIKPGCVLRRSNFAVLEREGLVSKDEAANCKRNLNTFAYVGDLKGNSPEVSCVYHSEEAENAFMQDPKKAVLGDGTRELISKAKEEDGWRPPAEP